MGVARGGRGNKNPWILKILAKKVVFLFSSEKKKYFASFVPQEKIIGKIPQWPLLEKILPTPILTRRYERISFSQHAIYTAIVSIICKAIRRFGKTLSSPYSTVTRMQEILKTRLICVARRNASSILQSKICS